MAREPQDRDETKRSALPPAGGSNPADARDRSKRRDANEEAPRVQGAADDDGAEEWILVDDDLIAAAAEADAHANPKPGVPPASPGFKREADAAELIHEMKQAAADLAPVHFDEGGEAVEPVAAASDDMVPTLAPVDAQESAGIDGGEALAPPPEGQTDSPAIDEPALAPDAEPEPEPEPEAPAQKAKPRGPKAPRRSMAAAAGILVTAALGAGGWYAWQNYGDRLKKLWPTSDVASAPTGVDTPAPKPVAKPAPKNPQPAPTDPAATKPSGKSPTATDPKAAATPNGASIPVIPVNPAPDATATAAKPTAATSAKPAAPKSTPTSIVNAQNPIRPVKPLATAAAKTSSAVKKNDTIIELQNGYTLRGSVKRMKDDQITLGVPGGECTFSMADVKVLDSTAPEYMPETQMLPVSIVLKSGQRLRGKLLKSSPERVVIVVDHGQMVIDRDQIREVSFTGRIHF